ncbi:TetR/AcrR family transcriptional regulator [Protaetiibacter larvae]|uniref:TetR family transcriptional regulator n=1 Tax=Protaetiibacter larvae TaxID=2592654 RepID=A0A5C1Y7B4_9MICO|nr:TetR/AcrR family transcriptional regulator C-terminal domain-containing protein [Protaetiibacter larvae]QEO08767.1 TetR family transcriptional regulator [Protaetiibacter larvae]
MENASEAAAPHRLNRERVVRGAIELADRIGSEALSMRSLAKELGVVPMALYKHVTAKEELLDAMVDALIDEIDRAPAGPDWRGAIRSTVLSARRMLQRHPWARRVFETRTRKTPAVLDYLDDIAGMFLAGGFTGDLTHHAMHALGSRSWGFTQEIFDDASAPAEQPHSEHPQPAPAAAPDAATQEAMLREFAARYPHLLAAAATASHDDDSVVSEGCDDQFEFEFALDTLLDGFERLHRAGWSSRAASGRPAGMPYT